MHSDVTTSLEQLEHPGVKHQKASDKKPGPIKLPHTRIGIEEEVML